MNYKLILAACVSLLAYIVIGIYTTWQTALAVYVLVFITSLGEDAFK